MFHAITVRAAGVLLLATLLATPAVAQQGNAPAAQPQSGAGQVACPMYGYGMHGGMAAGMVDRQDQRGAGAANWQQMHNEMQAMRQQMQSMHEEMMKLRQELHRRQ